MHQLRTAQTLHALYKLTKFCGTAFNEMLLKSPVMKYVRTVTSAIMLPEKLARIHSVIQQKCVFVYGGWVK